ncbi:MAG: hypothetical protein A3F67_03640 [Verrucomicrobia bacterium RIFCSPHIGHO2_12_FULL_41_10]|nr:MAG: hypothetical protein A3F67_03640 [Verrucomicrobia bacterium RIFCSPHIGHO2_12_FULL_41_10]
MNQCFLYAANYASISNGSLFRRNKKTLVVSLFLLLTLLSLAPLGAQQGNGTTGSSSATSETSEENTESTSNAWFLTPTQKEYIGIGVAVLVGGGWAVAHGFFGADVAIVGTEATGDIQNSFVSPLKRTERVEVADHEGFSLSEGFHEEQMAENSSFNTLSSQSPETANDVVAQRHEASSGAWTAINKLYASSVAVLKVGFHAASASAFVARDSMMLLVPEEIAFDENSSLQESQKERKELDNQIEDNEKEYLFPSLSSPSALKRANSLREVYTKKTALLIGTSPNVSYINSLRTTFNAPIRALNDEEEAMRTSLQAMCVTIQRAFLNKGSSPVSPRAFMDSFGTRAKLYLKILQDYLEQLQNLKKTYPSNFWLEQKLRAASKEIVLFKDIQSRIQAASSIHSGFDYSQEFNHLFHKYFLELKKDVGSLISQALHERESNAEFSDQLLQHAGEALAQVIKYEELLKKQPLSVEQKEDEVEIILKNLLFNESSSQNLEENQDKSSIFEDIKNKMLSPLLQSPRNGD